MTDFHNLLNTVQSIQKIGLCIRLFKCCLPFPSIMEGPHLHPLTINPICIAQHLHLLEKHFLTDRVTNKLKSKIKKQLTPAI